MCVDVCTCSHTYACVFLFTYVRMCVLVHIRTHVIRFEELGVDTAGLAALVNTTCQSMQQNKKVASPVMIALALNLLCTSEGMHKLVDLEVCMNVCLSRMEVRGGLAPECV